MHPETDLSVLLTGLQPTLQAEEYVFCSVPKEKEHACWTEQPLATFREDEGLSVVMAKPKADALELTYSSIHRCIRLEVYSSLEAVGLTAAVSTKLADAGISANVIAATHHDHILVPTTHADRALKVLQTLSDRAAPHTH